MCKRPRKSVRGCGSDKVYLAGAPATPRRAYAATALRHGTITGTFDTRPFGGRGAATGECAGTRRSRAGPARRAAGIVCRALCGIRHGIPVPAGVRRSAGNFAAANRRAVCGSNRGASDLCTDRGAAGRPLPSAAPRSVAVGQQPRDRCRDQTHHGCCRKQHADSLRRNSLRCDERRQERGCRAECRIEHGKQCQQPSERGRRDCALCRRTRRWLPRGRRRGGCRTCR